MAIPIGLLLGFGSVIFVRSLMTAEQYNAWGWRIFFFVGFNFIDGVAASNQAFFVIRLKPYEDRTAPEESADAIITRLRPQLASISGAIVFPFNLPPILGLGSTGGFQYALEALQGQKPSDMAAVSRGLLVAANQQPELAGVFSTFAANTPQIHLDVDRAVWSRLGGVRAAPPTG